MGKHNLLVWFAFAVFKGLLLLLSLSVFFLQWAPADGGTPMTSPSSAFSLSPGTRSCEI